MFTVKQVSEMMDVSAHTLRFYDKMGLFPGLKRSDNQIRVFAEEDLHWVYIVVCMRKTGMSLSDIKSYIDLCKVGDKTIEQRYHIILEQKEKAELLVQEMEMRVEQLERKAQYYRKLMAERIPNDYWNKKEYVCMPSNDMVTLDY